MAKSTERHARETASKAAAVFGGNREGVRKARIIKVLRPDLFQIMQDGGDINTDQAYREAIGDKRVGISAQVAPQARDMLNDICSDWECDQAEVLTAMICTAWMNKEGITNPTQIFG